MMQHHISTLLLETLLLGPSFVKTQSTLYLPLIFPIQKRAHFALQVGRDPTKNHNDISTLCFSCRKPNQHPNFMSNSIQTLTLGHTDCKLIQKTYHIQTLLIIGVVHKRRRNFLTVFDTPSTMLEFDPDLPKFYLLISFNIGI